MGVRIKEAEEIREDVGCVRYGELKRLAQNQISLRTDYQTYNKEIL